MKIFEIYAATTGLDEMQAENVGFERFATITHETKLIIMVPNNSCKNYSRQGEWKDPWRSIGWW